MSALTIETVRGRLTAFYITVLGVVLVIVGGPLWSKLSDADIKAVTAYIRSFKK